jgi:glycosyltransferase involved in cell wall biosynthesis
MSPPELDFKLSFVGPIPDDQRLVHEKVQYYGQVADRMQLREIYKEHDILVSPSFSEGMPNAILEAMALSLSALSTNTGAVSALVTPQTGWLIESPPNPYDIRDAMVEIVQARELLQAKRHAAHSHVQANFMWPEIIGQLIAEMEVLVERKK